MTTQTDTFADLWGAWCRGRVVDGSRAVVKAGPALVIDGHNPHLTPHQALQFAEQLTTLARALLDQARAEAQNGATK